MSKLTKEDLLESKSKSYLKKMITYATWKELVKLIPERGKTHFKPKSISLDNCYDYAITNLKAGFLNAGCLPELMKKLEYKNKKGE